MRVALPALAALFLVVPLVGRLPAADTHVRRDVPYNDPADANTRLDIYSDEEADGWPVMVWIHGGGWQRGDKSAVHAKPAALVGQQFVFVSINYRFVPEVTVVEMAGDVAKAIAWVHEHATELGGDPQKIFVGGHSAGAHLAALVAVDEKYLQAEGMQLSSLKGCVAVDTAVYDIPAQVARARPVRAALYRTPFGQDAAVQKQLSPITHVSENKGIPPFLILHVADRPDSTAQSRAFAKALEQAGVAVTVVAAEGKTHGSINSDLGKPDDGPTEALLKFLKAYRT